MAHGMLLTQVMTRRSCCYRFMNSCNNIWLANILLHTPHHIFRPDTPSFEKSVCAKLILSTNPLKPAVI